MDDGFAKSVVVCSNVALLIPFPVPFILHPDNTDGRAYQQNVLYKSRNYVTIVPEQTKLLCLVLVASRLECGKLLE